MKIIDKGVKHMANKKYDYSRFTIPTEIELKNGVYVLTDGERYYIGKSDDKDRGFRQRYGTYVNNKGRGVVRTSGDKFFQSSDNVKMYWLYWCNAEDVETVKDVESFFMKQYRILHGDKLVNANIKDSIGIMFSDVRYYFMKIEHRGNVPLLLEHGVMRPNDSPLPTSKQMYAIKQGF